MHVSLRKDSEKVPRRGTPLSSGDHKLWLVELTGRSCVCSFVLCWYLPRTGPQTDNYSLFQVASHCSSGVSLQSWSCAPARGRRWCADGLCDLSILLAGVITVTITRTFRNTLQSHLATQLYARYAVFAFFKDCFFAEIITRIHTVIKIGSIACSKFRMVFNRILSQFKELVSGWVIVTA